MTDFTTWLVNNQETVFTISRYRKMFTPYEEENKFSDETAFEDTYQGKIKSAINLGYDTLLEINVLLDTIGGYDGEFSNSRVTNYELLSNVSLSVYKDESEE